MKTRFLTISTLIIFILFSCKKGDEHQQESSDIPSKEEIKKIASMHSEALKHIQNYKLQTKGGPDTEVPPDPEPPETMPAEVIAVYMGFQDYIVQNDLQEYAFLGSSTPGYNFENIPKQSLSATNSAHSVDFYTLANSISNIEGNSLTDVESQINIIEISTKFQNLSNIEKTILLTSAEVFLDSYRHWSNEPQLNEGTQGIATKGWFSKLFKFVKADFLGAVGGGITGAAFIGGPVGAGIGAAVGAISCSSIAAIEAEHPDIATIPEEFVIVQGVTIPKQWDEILVPSNSPIEVPSTEEFPQDYTGFYYYGAELINHYNGMIAPSTQVYKGANGLYYYTSNLTCQLPNGFYRNGTVYYKVVSGRVVETGTVPPMCSICPETNEVPPNPFVECGGAAPDNNT